MFSVRLFLFRLTLRKYVLAAHERRPSARVVALTGLLDLDHLGAHVAQDMAQNGPASTRVRSMTRTPASGSSLVACSFYQTGTSLTPIRVTTEA